MARRFESNLFGFSVELEAGLRVAIDLERWSLVVRDPAGGSSRIGFPDAPGIAQIIANAFERRPRGKRGRFVTPNEIETVWGDLIVVERERLLARVPREVIDVHAAVRDAAQTRTGIHEDPRFYARRYLVQDVLRQRAAAIAVGYARRLLPGRIDGDPEALLDDLERWPGLFSPSGYAYGSLRRTLAQLPRGVPGSFVCTLRHLRLPRPVTNPTELIAIGLSLDVRSRPGGAVLERLLLRASADEIQRAVVRVGEAIGESLWAVSVRDLIRAVRYLSDYPEPYGGRLEGFAAKAVEWHEALARRRAARGVGITDRAGSPVTKTALPPFPLPKTSGIRFLTTVADIEREGQVMGHCVATRAAAAVSGDAFLFHVDYEGQKATVEIGRDGEVVEASGPGNRRNAAVTWGRRALVEWWRWSRREGRRSAVATEFEPSSETAPASTSGSSGHA